MTFVEEGVYREADNVSSVDIGSSRCAPRRRFVGPHLRYRQAWYVDVAFRALLHDCLHSLSLYSRL